MSQRQVAILRDLHREPVPAAPPVQEGHAVWLVEVPHVGFQVLHVEDAAVLERLAAITGGFHQDNLVVIHPQALEIKG
jgi:hypothetical protein